MKKLYAQCVGISLQVRHNPCVDKGFPGRKIDAMPGGVGSFVESDLRFSRTSLTAKGSSHAELRRAQVFTVFSSECVELLRNYVVKREHKMNGTSGT